MKVVVGSDTHGLLSESDTHGLLSESILLKKQDVPFDIDLCKEMTIVHYRDDRFSLFFVNDPADVDDTVKRVLGEIIKGNPVIFCCFLTYKQTNDYVADKKIKATKKMVLAFQGYCPKTASEIGYFLKDRYCNCHTGCQKRCQECSIFPGRDTPIPEKEKKGWRNFIRTWSSCYHAFSFCSK